MAIRCILTGFFLNEKKMTCHLWVGLLKNRDPVCSEKL